MSVVEGVWLEIRTPLAPKGIFPTRRTDSRDLTRDDYTTSQLPTENIVLSMPFNRLLMPTLEIRTIENSTLAGWHEQCRRARHVLEIFAKRNIYEFRIDVRQLRDFLLSHFWFMFMLKKNKAGVKQEKTRLRS